MNIVVCISSVPDTTSKINFTDNGSKFDANGIQFIINPYDEFGLTKAMMLKEASGGKVTVVTVGEAAVDSVIRKALAIGADKAVRINQKPSHGIRVAELIESYCNDNNFDIILCGRESIDYNGGIVPGLVATKLDIPFINGCIDLEINNQKANTKREIDGGHEINSVNLPCLIAGQKGIVEEKDLRIPSMRGIMTARSKPLEVIDLIIEAQESISIIKHEKPAQRSECIMIDEDNIEKLVDLLINEAKVI